MRTATYIKRLDWETDARLYRLGGPVRFKDYRPAPTGEIYEIEGETDHVVVSASSSPMIPETYIFPADEAGRALSMGELPGSYKGGRDHEEALRRAGYAVEKPSRSMEEQGPWASTT